MHVTLAGEPVVDLWGGAADAAVSHLWTADTLVNVWSTTKGCLALAMHMLADRGLLGFDTPVAYYWPEFAQHGKGAVLIRHILTQTAGLPAPTDSFWPPWYGRLHRFCRPTEAPGDGLCNEQNDHWA